MLELEKKELSNLSKSTNDLFDAMSIVAKSVIQAQQYDKTIEAKIVSAERKEEGLYKVEYENAIFDAYSAEKHYCVNEIVYVHIPGGDFTKQKHIVGRKVDLEAAPDRTFNFKMPFDDFVGLESLTAKSLYVYGKKGFLANYPEHGKDFLVDDVYLNQIKPLQEQIEQLDTLYNVNLETCHNNVKRLQSLLDSSHLAIAPFYLQPYMPGRQMTNYIVPSNETTEEDNFADRDFNDVIQTLFRMNASSQKINYYFQLYVNILQTTESKIGTYGSEDKRDFEEAINEYQEWEEAQLKANWLQQRQRLVNQANNLLTVYTGHVNYNHLWSWVNDSTNRQTMTATRLGIQLDVQTLLGQYRPIKGEYGLKIRITGRTKQTEDNPSITQTEEIIWTNEQMYGNTYAFTVPYNQQRIFDISGYLWLDRIDIFFYQDNRSASNMRIDPDGTVHQISYNFIDEHGVVIPYESETQNPDGTYDLLPYNIYYDNLEVLLGLSTDECETDRVFLYTYDNIQFGYNPETGEQEPEPIRELRFAWVHRTENNGIVLVNHAKAEYEGDRHALETYNANIYWYHNELGVQQDTSDIRQKYGGVNWRFMNDYNAEEGETINATYTLNWLEDQAIWEHDNQGNLVKYYNVFQCKVALDPGKVKERFKACVVFNSVPYMSEPVIFSNYNQNLYSELDDVLNEVTFRILKESVNDNGDLVIVEDNSLTNFLVYDQQGIAIQDDNNVSYDNIWYYLQVWVRNNDTGDYSPLPSVIDNFYEANTFEIEWLLPSMQNSMLQNIQPINNYDLRYAEISPTTPSNSAEYNEAIRSVTRKFQIAKHWDLRKTDNTIAAIVKRNGKIYRPQKQFFFGESGTMGSSHTVAIYKTLPETPAMVEGEEFTIKATVYGPDGKELPNFNYRFVWELLSPTKITASALEDDSDDWQTLFSKLTFTDDETGNVQNVLHGYIRNDFPPVFRVTVLNTGDEWYKHGIATTQAFKLVDSSGTNTAYRINCLDKIEFRSDGKTPVGVDGPIEVYHIGEDDSTLRTMIYPDWEIVQYKRNTSTSVDWELQDSLKYIGLNQKTVASKNITNNALVYVWCNMTNGQVDYTKGFTKARDVNHTQSVLYTTMRDNITLEYSNAMATAASADVASIEETYQARMEALDETVGTIIPQHYEYSIDRFYKYTSGNKVPWQWEDGMTDLYYTVVQFYTGHEYFKQAITFCKNVYSSSLLNTWNSTTLTLDDKNNAVLARMISAGAKDSENRFTGVIMGDWAEKGDSSLNVPGLYGFKYGDQAFAFKTDGSGYIGRSGRGRIEFDGNSSLIANVDRSCYLNLDPTKFLTNPDGSITPDGDYIGYSQYFLYAKVPKSTKNYNFHNEPDTLQEIASWTREFMNDAENEYFIVDPTNGVLTTGGIIAKYGKIGNWLISQTGLYQQHIDEVANQNRFMYLGYSDLDDNTYASINNTYKPTYEAIERRRNQVIEEIKAKYRQKEFQLIGQYYAKIFEFDPMHYFNQGWPIGLAIDILTLTLGHYDEYVENLTDDEIASIEAQMSADHMSKENVALYRLINKYSQQILTKDDYVRNRHAHYQFTATGEISSIFPNQITGGMNYSCYKSIIPFCGYEGVSPDYNRPDDEGNYKYANPNTGRWVERKVTSASRLSTSICYYASYQYTGPDRNDWYVDTWMLNHGATTTICYGLAYTQESLTRRNIQEILDWISIYYDYHLTAYNTQLEAMLNEGRNRIKGAQINEYEKQRLEWQRMMLQEIEEANKKYDDLRHQVDVVRGQTIAEAVEGAIDNKWMIRAGYTRESDPLFSVNWRGSAQMREALIGYKSPWLVMDYGLTQTNNSGSIFLGDPDAPYNMQDWAHYGDQIIQYNANTNSLAVQYKNTGQTQSRNIYSLKNASSGDAIGPLAYGSYGRFAIQAGNVNGDRAIHFGVRMDGTLFSDRGKIGNWLIAPTLLGDYANDTTNVSANISSSNGDEYIALDSANHQIRLSNSQMVLDGKKGVLYIGNKIIFNEQAYTKGAIYLARVGLVGLTTGSTTFDTNLSAITLTTQLTQYTNIEFAYTDNDENAEFTGSIRTTEQRDPGSLEQAGGAYLVRIETSTIPENRRLNLINNTIAAESYPDKFDVGLFVDANNPTIDNANVPNFTQYGIRVEFLNNIRNKSGQYAYTSATNPSFTTAYSDAEIAAVGYTNGACILMPLKNGSSLGMPGKRWNIYANYVQIGNSFAATLEQVYENDNRLQNNIIRVNQATAAAFKKACQALAAAMSALARIKRIVTGTATEADGQAWGLTVDPVTGTPILKLDTYVDQALQNLAGSNPDSLAQAVSAGIEELNNQGAWSSSVADALQDLNNSGDLGGYIESALTDGSSVYSRVEAIARAAALSVFEEMWGGVALDVTGSGNTVTAIVTGGPSGQTLKKSISCTVKAAYTGGALLGSGPSVTSDGTATCGHYVGTITAYVDSITW